MEIDKAALAVAWLQEHEPEMAAQIDAKFQHIEMPMSPDEVNEWTLSQLAALVGSVAAVYDALTEDELAAMERAERHVT